MFTWTWNNIIINNSDSGNKKLQLEHNTIKSNDERGAVNLQTSWFKLVWERRELQQILW